VYLIGRVGKVPVAYGMLRGWDDGFDVPSVGVAVRSDCEHRGFGRAMMRALHAAARKASASTVRLRVHPQNTRALALYRFMGYREAGLERGEILMLCDVAEPFSPAPAPDRMASERASPC
jgi:ribosomal protein S18 acetylase RimI-like enzyme